MISTRSLLFAFAATASVFAFGTASAKDEAGCCDKAATGGCCDKTTAGSCKDKTDGCGGKTASSQCSGNEAWLKAAKAAYPLDTCVVSDDKLEGDMGAPIDYVYKEAGKPDRLVRFCCKNCIKDFKKSPEKYLTKIDAAAKNKAASAPATHS